MRAPVTNRAIEEFAIPPEAPAEVAAAHERYTGLVADLRQQRVEAREAEDAIEQAREADLDALGRKLAEGSKQPTAPHGGERKARERFDDLRDQVAALESGVDHAGDLVAQAIEAARDAWLEALRAAQDEAAGRFRSAVREAGEALDALAAPAEVLPWLEGFAAWKTEGAYRGQLAGGHASFRRQLPDEIAEAFGGLAQLAATLEAPAPPPPTQAEQRAELRRKVAAEREQAKAERAAAKRERVAP